MKNRTQIVHFYDFNMHMNLLNSDDELTMHADTSQRKHEKKKRMIEALNKWAGRD